MLKIFGKNDQQEETNFLTFTCLIILEIMIAEFAML